MGKLAVRLPSQASNPYQHRKLRAAQFPRVLQQAEQVGSQPEKYACSFLTACSGQDTRTCSLERSEPELPKYAPKPALEVSRESRCAQYFPVGPLPQVAVGLPTPGPVTMEGPPMREDRPSAMVVGIHAAECEQDDDERTKKDAAQEFRNLAHCSRHNGKGRLDCVGEVMLNQGPVSSIPTIYMPANP